MEIRSVKSYSHAPNPSPPPQKKKSAKQARSVWEGRNVSWPTWYIKEYLNWGLAALFLSLEPDTRLCDLCPLSGLGLANPLALQACVLPVIWAFSGVLDSSKATGDLADRPPQLSTEASAGKSATTSTVMLAGFLRSCPCVLPCFLPAPIAANVGGQLSLLPYRDPALSQCVHWGHSNQVWGCCLLLPSWLCCIEAYVEVEGVALTLVLLSVCVTSSSAHQTCPVERECVCSLPTLSLFA